MNTCKNSVFALTVLIAVSTLCSCSRPKSYYVCQCSPRISTNAPSDSAYNLGEIAKKDAYTQCFVHNNAQDTCVMITIQ